jgi:hypothetical protein
VTLKLTARDKQILYWLFLFVLAFGIWYFLIKPAREKNNELMTLISAADARVSEYRQKAEDLDSIRQAYKSAESSRQAEASHFYCKLSSSDIDGLFTGLAVSNSLQVNRLSVDISEADSVIMPYVFSEIPPEGYEEGLRGLNTAFVRLEVSGSAGNIYKLIDEICALRAVLLKRLDWWPYYTGTVHESFYMRSEDDKTAARLELELYMCS